MYARFGQPDASDPARASSIVRWQLARTDKVGAERTKVKRHRMSRFRSHHFPGCTAVARNVQRGQTTRRECVDVMRACPIAIAAVQIGTSDDYAGGVA